MRRWKGNGKNLHRVRGEHGDEEPRIGDGERDGVARAREILLHAWSSRAIRLHHSKLVFIVKSNLQLLYFVGDARCQFELAPRKFRGETRFAGRWTACGGYSVTRMNSRQEVLSLMSRSTR